MFQEDYFLIECLIVKVDTRHGWYYDGCARCGSKSKMLGGKLSCPSNSCKGKQFVVEPKMKVHYIVEDVSGKASVVFFDKLATQYIGRTAAEMKSTLDKEDRAYDFPDELDNLVGKRLILKLKLNKYNKDYPNSSISVSSYTELADLMNEFDQAADPEVNVTEESTGFEVVGEEDVEDSTLNHAAAIMSQDSVPDINGLDDMPIASIVTNVISKGKRKISAKKAVAEKEKSVAGLTISPAKKYVKAPKPIKQEKN